MCIRDSSETGEPAADDAELVAATLPDALACGQQFAATVTCLLYTSDAADERSSVDLGGRRIIKEKQA